SLVNALRAQVAQEGLPRITFRCSPYHTNSVLHPVIAHIQQLLGFEREDPLDVKLAKLERGLQPYALSVKDVVPLFAALLSVPLPEGRYPVLTGSPQQQRQRTLDALNAWLLVEAERQPVLVLWEDVHWADPTTLELLGLIAEQVTTSALLTVLTFRPDFVPPWPMRSHVTPLLLHRLEPPQVEGLMTRLAGGKRLPPDVLTHVVTRADGVPLYVEELTKALLESDLLEERTDHYRLTRPLSDVAIPMTLQDSLMARLDRVPAVREVAQLGAVLGREFAYEMVHALSVIDEQHLRDGLTKLVDAELLHQRGRPPQAKYIFKHALVQDAAYQSLLRRTRQHYHQRGAQVLETRFPELVQTEPELVAHHYTEAGCAAEAVGYWLQAGQRAGQRSAHHEAIAHLTKGIAVLTTLGDTPERGQQELVFQVTLGVSLVAVKGYGAPEVAEVYTRARALCQQVGETPQLFQVIRGLVLFYLVRSQTQPALELAEQLVSQVDRHTEVGPRMLGHYHLGMALFQRGVPVEAARHFEQAMSIYDREQHRHLAHTYGIDLGVATRGFLAWPLWLLGYPDRALALGQEAVTLAQELGHPFSLVFAECWLAWLHQYRREADAVHERAADGIRLATDQGFPLYRAWGSVAQGWALTQQGQLAAGITTMQQGIEAATTTGAEVYRPYFLALLAEASSVVGGGEDGLRLLDEALEVVEGTGERFYEAEVYRLKGELLLMQEIKNQKAKGKRQKSENTDPRPLIPDPHAEACFLKALDIARNQQAKSLELRAAMSLARLWRGQGKQSEAHKMVSDIYQWFTEGFDTKDLREARVLLEALA
ncbi:MAG: hypothetical protein HOP18_05715, partial [Deltaproteobacteria bacterium]|nr:hypothetical protein [Deltaproteobacteria bacterium]